MPIKYIWSSKTGHASIYSTTGDLHKFAVAIQERKLLSEGAWNKIFTDYGSHWGYGWSVSPQDGYKRHQINGRSPGFSSYFGIYPNENLIVIMLSNIYISLPYFVGPSIAAIAMGENYEQLNLSTDPMATQFANEVIGSYRFEDFYRPGGAVKISFKDGILYSDGNALIPVKEGQPNNKIYSPALLVYPTISKK